MKRLALVVVVLLMLFPAPVGACSGYVVQRGDTLYRIGLRNGTTWQTLARLNGLANPNRIYPGQCLQLPGAEVQPKAQNAPVVSSKGLAMADWSHPEDLAALRVTWFYGWGEYCTGQSGCLNMVRSMQLPQACYDTLLVGNEPNAWEPYGATVSPRDAAGRVKAIESVCPQTSLVIGNVSASAGGWGSGTRWLQEFLSAYGPGFHQILGVHCYTRHSADDCVNQFSEMRSVTSGEMWVTEFGVLSGDPEQFRVVLDYVSTHFARVAAYTNRQPAADWAINPGVELVDGNGNLTATGNLYADR